MIHILLLLIIMMIIIIMIVTQLTISITIIDSAVIIAPAIVDWPQISGGCGGRTAVT